MITKQNNLTTEHLFSPHVICKKPHHVRTRKCNILLCTQNTRQNKSLPVFPLHKFIWLPNWSWSNHNLITWWFFTNISNFMDLIQPWKSPEVTSHVTWRGVFTVFIWVNSKYLFGPLHMINIYCRQKSHIIYFGFILEIRQAMVVYSHK